MLIMYSTKKYSQAWTNKSHAIKRATYMYEGKENIASNDLYIPIKKIRLPTGHFGKSVEISSFSEKHF